MAFSSITIIFLFLSYIQPSVAADPRLNLIARVCSNIEGIDPSESASNFVESMEALERPMKEKGFGQAAAGRIFMMAQCMGDMSHSDCGNCFSESRSLFSECFPSGGRVYLDGCLLRGENYSFYGESITPDDKTVCGVSHGAGSDYATVTEHLICELLNHAQKNNGYWKTTAKSRGSNISALAICWKSLSKRTCNSCLENAAENVLSCLPAAEGCSLNAGCFVRYSSVIANQIDFKDKSIISLAIVYFICIMMTSITAITIGVCLGKSAYRQLHNESEVVKGIDMESSVLKNCLHFQYSTLEKATSSFSESNKLGEGGFGQVYKGILPDGREIAIKRLFVNAKNNGTQVYNEMNIVSRAHHKNLVRFLGCSLSGHASLLVYEFVVNKSLDQMLFDPMRKKELDWKKRLGIIIGTAEGLQYLHNECAIKIVHSDIKASNILLDVRFRPKIADFGLARFSSGKESQAGMLTGTLGYMAPEYITNGRLTEKVDVYSYGVLVLEIIGGVQNNKYKPDVSLDTLVTCTWKHFQSNSLSEIIDKSMEVNDTEEVLRVAQVALLCTQEMPNLRPPMSKVVQMLRQKEFEIPTPSKPPFVDEHMELSDMSNPPNPLQKSISDTNHYRDLESR